MREHLYISAAYAECRGGLEMTCSKSMHILRAFYTTFLKRVSTLFSFCFRSKVNFPP